jgi:hypothetical protein
VSLTFWSCSARMANQSSPSGSSFRSSKALSCARCMTATKESACKRRREERLGASATKSTVETRGHMFLRFKIICESDLRFAVSYCWYIFGFDRELRCRGDPSLRLGFSLMKPGSARDDAGDNSCSELNSTFKVHDRRLLWSLL